MWIFATGFTWLIGWVGWDPIFEFEGKTYAEMDKAEKVCWMRLPGL